MRSIGFDGFHRFQALRQLAPTRFVSSHQQDRFGPALSNEVVDLAPAGVAAVSVVSAAFLIVDVPLAPGGIVAASLVSGGFLVVDVPILPEGIVAVSVVSPAFLEIIPGDPVFDPIPLEATFPLPRLVTAQPGTYDVPATFPSPTTSVAQLGSYAMEATFPAPLTIVAVFAEDDDVE